MLCGEPSKAMKSVPAHRHTSISQDLRSLLIRLITTPLTHPLLVLAACYSHMFCGVAHAQILINGQVFTNGLSILDSPNPNRCVQWDRLEETADRINISLQ